MPRPSPGGRTRFDIADIVRGHRASLEREHPLQPEQKRVLTDIAQCRTALLGGHVGTCTSCGLDHPAYNSCRNRHCPKCQALAQEEWIDARSAHVLDVLHFHVVFTLPSELRALTRYRPKEVFSALFSAVRLTLLELGNNRLDARLGATLVLHTWTRELDYHPHVHAVVTGGGLSPDGKCWKAVEHDYLLPVKMMGSVFRAKMLAALNAAHREGDLEGFSDFEDPEGFDRLMRKVSAKAWNVYAEPSFDNAEGVLKYLGRYTHRVAISNSRLVDVSESAVTFRTRDDQTVTVTPVEFLRRFVLHVLPDGFHKIRHIGLYASACIDTKLATARALLGMSAPVEQPKLTWQQKLEQLTGRDPNRCRRCGGQLLFRRVASARSRKRKLKPARASPAPH